jgi:hypothetical protein
MECDDKIECFAKSRASHDPRSTTTPAMGMSMTRTALWTDGNFDYDQDLNLNDLGTLATNFGGAGREAAMAAFEGLVPEPIGSVGLL